MIEKICSYDKCTGCALCHDICPENSITMSYDDEGFLRPNINNDTCIECGKCVATCTINNPYLSSNTDYSYYLAWNNDIAIRLQSSSGGIMSALAKYVLDKGGAVVGAAFDNSWNLHQCIVSDSDSMQKLRGSKYIQSDSHGIYMKTKKQLDLGRYVLFVGTPCQITALHRYLNCDYDCLITCDFICYGVSSTKYFNDFINKKSGNRKQEITNIEFRKKVYGCQNSSFSLTFADGKKSEKLLYIHEFGLLFSRRLINRKTCYDCQFSSEVRVSDFTLSDYHPGDLCDQTVKSIKSGISLVRVNNEKAMRILDAISHGLHIENRDNDYVNKAISRIKFREVDTTERDTLFEEYKKFGYEFVKDKYYKYSLKQRLRLRYTTILLLARRYKDKLKRL